MAPKEPKSRKPTNTAFKQQRLKAWQPILTPKTVLPTFFIVGIIFAPLGGLLLYASDSVSELNIDYTSCLEKAQYSFNNNSLHFTQMPEGTVETNFAQSNTTLNASPSWAKYNRTIPYKLDGGIDGNFVNAITCVIKFTIPSELKNTVFLYYRLTNFYQNHRRYVKSFDAKQLKGEAVSINTLKSGNCKPLAESDGIIYYPCGLIANSMFNDTIYNPQLLNAANPTAASEPYEFSYQNIAWPSDKQKYEVTKYDVKDIQPPPNWSQRYVDGRYNETTKPQLKTDEHFQVWMRTAGLPDFRKLYGKNKTQPMKAGLYQIEIDYWFPVIKYGGTKSIVISTVSFLGGKNPFLGIAYITVGIVCVVLGSLFTARHLYKPRKLGDHTYLSWNQNHSPAGGVTTGPQF